jgi:hypothetical protein
VTDDHDGRRRRPLVVSLERAPEQRRRRHNGEGGCADLHGPRRLRQAVAGQQMPVNAARSAEVFDPAGMLAPHGEIAQRACVRGPALHVPDLDADDALGAGDAQLRIESVAHELEVRGACADRHRQADDRDHGEAGRFPQHAHAELEIHRPAHQPAERARVALMFLGLLDAAERAPCRVSRVGCTHPLRHELLFEQLQVRVHLAREVRLGPREAEQR